MRAKPEHPLCMRIVQRIECPTCGYPQSEAMFSLSEVANDPGCPYEDEEREIPDAGVLETWEDDVHAERFSW